MIQRAGLFNWVGIDYGLFWAGARAFLKTGPASVYDLEVLTRHVQLLAPYYGPQAPPLQVGPVPYPPIFMLLITPLGLLDAPSSFAIWTLLNLALAVYVVRALASRFSGNSWLLVAIVVMFFPLGYSLFVGQVTVILLFAFYRAYVAFERGDDLQAGLWSGVLLIKPQYAIFLALVLLYKRRWKAMSGIIVAGLCLLLSSLVLLGPQDLIGYYSSLGYASSYQSGQSIVHPELMISWRGLLVNFAPGLSEMWGLAVTAGLSALTVGALLLIWRGRWEPQSEQFSVRMLAVVLVTLLCSFHSHTHGAALLVVPGMALAAQGGGPPLMQSLMRISLFAPMVVLILMNTFVISSVMLTALMLLALVVILVDSLFREYRSRHVLDSGTKWG